MSLNFGYWPNGYRPSIGPIYNSKFRDGVVKLPKRYEGYAKTGYYSDAELGYDEFARAALETYRDSYNPMPTGTVKEFGRFFSAQNFQYLKEAVKKLAGYYADDGELFDMMVRSFSMIKPRSDEMDMERRTNFSDEVTQSYVDEMNKYVLDNLPEEVKQANRLWDFYAKNRNGPSEMPDHPGIDTRSRNVGSLYPFDYWMPDDD
jgi:hypothetical protein